MSSTKPLLVYILCYAGRFGTPGSLSGEPDYFGRNKILEWMSQS